MNLNRVYIQRYGPLQKELNLDDDINVIQGPNESGKSLLVEALLKEFVDSSIPTPRIQEHLEGFVELEVDDGVHKLGDGDTLSSFFSEHYNADVRSDEVQNIFVVRNGDLSSGHDKDFYSQITDRLTGRRVEDIDTIKDELLDAGRLTPGHKKISSDNKYDDAGNQVEEARQLRDDINSYLESAEERGLPQKESQLFGAKKDEEELEENTSQLEDAKQAAEKREKLDDLTEEKEGLESNLEDLAKLPHEDDLDDIDDQVQELSVEEGQVGELTENKESNLSLAKWSIAAGGISFLASLVLNAASIGAIVGLGFLVAGIYLWRKANTISGKITNLQIAEEQVLSDARAAGLEFEDRDEIRGKIATIEERRDELEKDNQGKKAVLERELEFVADSMGDVVEKAEALLDDLEDSIDDSIEVEYDEEEAGEIEGAYREAKKRRKTLDKELEEHQDRLDEFNERANKLDFNIFVGERLNLEIENLDAVEQLTARLQEFIDSIESDAEASRVAIKIFNEIQEEEREETAELFEEGSRATEIFRHITNDRYNRISYDNQENRLIVEKSTGETFEPHQLSEGTQDQLYLSIRVALAEQILDGDTGFFIMDDAFLTSDATRLSVQGGIVEQLAEEGWQIIYLTSKQDAVDELSARTRNEVVELPPLE